MTMIDVNKTNFLEKYNSKKSIVVAQSRAIAAAVQHNKLYSDNLDLQTKKKIRVAWLAALTSKAAKYVTTQSVKSFEADCISMQQTMNDLFFHSFQSQHKGGSGFRISHSQKSLSIYLKHLWCLNMIVTPPICPIDNVVLSLTDAKGFDATWTFVNSLEEHRKRFAFIQKEAEKFSLPIAEWELLNFKP